MNDRYPIVTDIVPSQQTAEILKNLLYSQDGFLTLNLTYLYQSWLQSTQDKEFGRYLKTLADNNGAIVDALGNITIAFGGDPNFVTTNGRNWTTQNLLLQKNREMFLKNVLQVEKKSIQSLDSAITGVENVTLKHLLSTIKEDKENIVKDLAKFVI